MQYTVGLSLYIKCGKVSVRSYVCNAGRGQLSSEWRHNENGDCERRRRETGEWRHNDNSWLTEIWQLATCGHGLQHSSTRRKTRRWSGGRPITHTHSEAARWVRGANRGNYWPKWPSWAISSKKTKKTQSPAEVAEFDDVGFWIEKEILWLDVAMTDATGVNVRQTTEQLIHV